MKGDLHLACLVGLAAKALGASSFAGSELYYAAGLNTTQQEYLFSNLQDSGIKVLRVWLEADSTLKGSEPGVWNDEVLNRLDDVMVTAQRYGIKLWISIHSYNTLLGNGDFYGAWYGTSDFYTNNDAISYFKNRIAHVLSHANPNNGKTWAESPEYIFGFEAQNEADQPNTHPDTTVTWQCTMAQALKTALRDSPSILVGTGGGGWVDSSLPTGLFSCAALDVLAIHAYGAADLTTTKLGPRVTQAQAAGKKLILQEWGGADGGVLDAAARDANPRSWADAANQEGIPWMYWQDYEIGVGGVDWETFQEVAKGTGGYAAAFDFLPWLDGLE
ncbi:beta-1,3-mannanase [Camillea tinctor]|nr:beta-1,3-mannanase [Camillea tinctor]